MATAGTTGIVARRARRARSTRAALALAVAGLSIAGFVAPATGQLASEPAGAGPGASRPDEPAPSRRPIGREAAEATDLALIARAKGWSEAQAARHRETAERLGALQARIATQRPGLYAGAALSREPGGTPTLFVKGSADEFVRQAVRDSGIAVELVEGRRHSYAELEARSMRLHRQLARRGYKQIATSFDESSGRVEGTVSRQPGAPGNARELRASLPPEFQTDTDLAVVDEPIAADQHAFGGNWVRDDGARECTSGFAVSDGTTTGVTTAGHCTGINEIEEPGVGVHALTLQQEHRGQWGDIQWHTSTHIEPAQFYATQTDIREVNSVEPRASITVGEAICVYGRSSNSRYCGAVVYRTSVSCTVNGFFNDRLVAMDDANGTINGDSGGGWTFGTRAYGSVKGRCTFDGASRSVFSVADLYDEALGVSVLTQ